MTTREKHFLSYDDQITLLKQQGMIVSDELFAKEVLENVGYYELVNGYKTIFKPKGRGRYLPGTTFEELLTLYKFDENLRQLFFKYILRIEIHMRSILSYAFCERFGDRQAAYLTRENYDTDGPAKDEINHLIGELDRAANRGDQAVYVMYYRQKYHDVPLWVLFKVLSQGTLNRFLRCSVPEIRQYAADRFPDLREKTLCRMLSLMQDFRNVCAHNDCLYSFRGEDTIPMMPAVRMTAHGSDTNGRLYKGSDLFALLVVFRYLLDERDYRNCVDALKRILASFEAGCRTVDREALLRTMGFPEDWETMSLS